MSSPGRAGPRERGPLAPANPTNGVGYSRRSRPGRCAGTMAARMGRVAVVGHVEWIPFAVVDRVPGAGDIAHASEAWGGAGGGGGGGARHLAKSAGASDL